ncbi:MAG: hypothetical protein HQL54_11330 [Magnetococcales bacterium]|nr:hypothetical protein [Magnetococcales bacterium]
MEIQQQETISGLFNTANNNWLECSTNICLLTVAAWSLFHLPDTVNLVLDTVRLLMA